MNAGFKINKHWLLGLVLFVGFAFLGLNLVIENSLSVDGPLRIGFPLVFYTLVGFPPNIAIHFPNLLINLLAYFLSSLGITLIIQYLINYLRARK